MIIIKFSIFTNKNSQSDTFFPKLINTIEKIDIKSFSVNVIIRQKPPLAVEIHVKTEFCSLLDRIYILKVHQTDFQKRHAKNYP